MSPAESEIVLCYKCNSETEIMTDSKVHRSEECPKCFASLHSCMMCFFYDKTAYNECREPMANRILEKEKANFCEFYKLKGSAAEGDKKENLMDAANALFKDK
mgnify:CR=1 FL=1|tara:strand:- start:279639 stop:279947 length:309 start_codon:yes stop_codon:yes gene_type:complete